MIKLAEHARETSGLTAFKISLYESKAEYQKAFGEHLICNDYFKYVFVWLTTTFDKLKKEEILWKKENGFEVIEEKKTQEKLPDDQSHSDDDCESGSHSHGENETENRKKSVADVDYVDPNPYPVLQDLKYTVKKHMRKLVQKNSEAAVELIEKYLTAGNYQEELIMSQFEHFPKERLDFLTNYIRQNEKQIELEMRTSSSLSSLGQKFKRYILIFA